MSTKPKKPKPPTSKTKAPTRSQLDKQCLDLWSLCARARDRCCRHCKSEERLSGHHIRVKSHNSTRYLLRNALTLCWKCHSIQHYRPEYFQDMVIEIIGQEEYDALKTISNGECHYKIKDLVGMRDHLKSVLKRLEQDYGKI